MMEPTWSEVEVPILEAIAAIESEGRTPNSERIVERTGLDEDKAARALLRLWDAEYIGGSKYAEGGDLYPRFLSAHLLERGLRVTQVWPSDDQYESLLSLIEARLERAADPAERSKLQKLRDGLTGLGKDSASALLIAWLKSIAGL